MGDAKVGLDLHHHSLGCYPAGPKDRRLSLVDRHGVTEVGFSEIFNPDGQRIADMDRGTVDRSVTRGDLNGTGDLVRRNGPHGNDHGPVKNSRRLAGDIGNEHRDILVLLDMAEGDLHPE